jgi:hypothetical protein
MHVLGKDFRVLEFQESNQLPYMSSLVFIRWFACQVWGEGGGGVRSGGLWAKDMRYSEVLLWTSLGTYGNMNLKNPSSHTDSSLPSPVPPPQKAKDEPSWVHVQSFHRLHAHTYYVPRHGCHHFWRGCYEHMYWSWMPKSHQLLQEDLWFCLNSPSSVSTKHTTPISSTKELKIYCRACYGVMQAHLFIL